MFSSCLGGFESISGCLRNFSVENITFADQVAECPLKLREIPREMGKYWTIWWDNAFLMGYRESWQELGGNWEIVPLIGCSHADREMALKTLYYLRTPKPLKRVVPSADLQ